jgi:hypothetical protein
MPYPRRVILESPYAGDVEVNIAYAREAIADSLARGEAPLASHLLYTQVLDDADPKGRKQGIEAGLAWLPHAQSTVAYIDLGVSSGMAQGIRLAYEQGRPVEMRQIRTRGQSSLESTPCRSNQGGAGYLDSDEFPPTYWMPLPAPPTGEKK